MLIYVLVAADPKHLVLKGKKIHVKYINPKGFQISSVNNVTHIQLSQRAFSKWRGML